MTGPQSFTVETTTHPPTPGSWDDVVSAAAAPFFYHADVLGAYHRHPLRTVLATFYVTVRNAATRSPVAVLPAYLQPADDPLGALPAMLPRYEPAGRPLLLSHVWHWYDTRLPATALTPELLDQVCAELFRLAAESQAQCFGFINVEDGGALAALLRATEREPTAIDARHTLDLDPFDDVDAYLATVPAKARQDLRRHHRLAAREGYTVTVEKPDRENMTHVARLCDVTAAKHGNQGWYLRQPLADFVCDLAKHTRLVVVRGGGVPVAASISFLDGGRFHNWAAGSLTPAELPFSPYMVLLRATVAAAFADGCTLLEGGRRNGAWKQRMGFTRRQLLGWAQAT